MTADLQRAWATGAREGLLEGVSAGGMPVLTAFSRLPEIGWGVAVAIPLAELTRPAVRSALTSLAVGLTFLAAGLGLAQLVARGITRPIVSLLGLAAAADHGDVDGPAVPALGLPEADRLATALLTEARRCRAALAALLDGERRLRLVVAELNHRAKTRSPRSRRWRCRRRAARAATRRASPKPSPRGCRRSGGRMTCWPGWPGRAPRSARSCAPAWRPG